MRSDLLTKIILTLSYLFCFIDAEVVLLKDKKQKQKKSCFIIQIYKIVLNGNPPSPAGEEAGTQKNKRILRSIFGRKSSRSKNKKSKLLICLLAA